MKTTHYSIRVTTNLSQYHKEDWPEYTESSYPRLGETVKLSDGAFLRVNGVIHSTEKIHGDWTHVVEVFLSW